MKIIHVTECFAGGTFEFLVSLIKEMPEYEHIIIYGKRENTPQNYRERFPPNIILIPWENVQREIHLWKDIKALLKLEKVLKRYITEKSIIHLHSSKAGFLGRIAACFVGKSKRVIYTTHGVSFLRRDVSKGKRLFYVLLEKIGSFFGGKIVVCSNSEGEKFKKYGIKKVAVIHNGIKIEKKQVEERKKTKDKTIIGTLARITYPKNPRQFNEIAEYFKENEKIKFLWIGDGELKNELKSSNIEITGWLEKEEAKEKLKEIDIYLSTSLWEGLPLSVLEAMTWGKSVVLSNCIGNLDIIKRENGYSFSTSKEAIEKIEELLINKEYLKWNEKSYKLVKHFFSIQKMIYKYNSIYQSKWN